MRLYIPGFCLLTFVLTGCATIEESPRSSTAPSAVIVPEVSAPASPKPASPEELAQGLAETLARGDVETARLYFLSAEEYDSLFNWPEGNDPRPEFAGRIDAALRVAAAGLNGGRFLRVIAPPAPRTLEGGTSLAGVDLEKSVQAIDSVTALVDVNGQMKRLQIDGLLQVGSYWRVFSPTFRVQ